MRLCAVRSRKLRRLARDEREGCALFCHLLAAPLEARGGVSVRCNRNHVGHTTLRRRIRGRLFGRALGLRNQRDIGSSSMDAEATAGRPPLMGCRKFVVRVEKHGLRCVPTAPRCAGVRRFCGGGPSSLVVGALSEAPEHCPNVIRSVAGLGMSAGHFFSHVSWSTAGCASFRARRT